MEKKLINVVKFKCSVNYEKTALYKYYLNSSNKCNSKEVDKWG